MNSLIYLSYGQGPHVDELVYSVLSAKQFLDRDRSDCRIVIYTDDASPFRNLPVHLECIRREILADWAGPLNFNHRRKIIAIRDALGRFGGRILYCDADTYFLRSPAEVFARIERGRTVMHFREGNLNECNGPGLDAFLRNAALRTVSGHRWKIRGDALMFNAGVVGMHEAETGLLDDILFLTDQIYEHVKIHTIEQFAFSVCLRQCSDLQETHDIICHYWPMPGRALFQQELKRVLHDPTIGSNNERLDRLSLSRPLPIIKRDEWTLKQLLRFELSRLKHAVLIAKAELENFPLHFHAARKR